MNHLIQLNLTMNPYLFGSCLLIALWWVTLITLRLTGKRDQIPEFWWASFSCAWLGITQPLFVPEYWNPPSIFKIGRWDLESFIFCFAVGGMAAVLTELPNVKSFLVRLYFSFEQIVRSVLSVFSKLTRGRLHARILDRPPSSQLVPREQTRIENMLLVTFAVGMFGATSHFSLNVIYDVAFVCIATAMMIGWRRPSLRWQIFGGGISFTIIYTVVLVIMDKLYPSFYNDYWNLEALSGIFFLDAPIEEYLFSFTFGIFWAPLYEAWKEVRVGGVVSTASRF